MAESLDYRRRRVKPALTPDAKTWVARVRWGALGICLLAAGCELWERRKDPFTGWEMMATDLMMGVVLIIIALGLLTLGLMVLLRYKCTWKEVVGTAMWGIMPALVLACVVVLDTYAVPCRMALGWSRAGLERAALEAKKDPAKGEMRRTIGVLPVQRIREIDGYMTVHVEGVDSDFEHLLVWSPGGMPRGPRFRGVYSMGVDWYQVRF